MYYHCAAMVPRNWVINQSQAPPNLQLNPVQISLGPFFLGLSVHHIACFCPLLTSSQWPDGHLQPKLASPQACKVRTGPIATNISKDRLAGSQRRLREILYKPNYKSAMWKAELFNNGFRFVKN